MKLALGTAQFGMDYGISNSRGKIPKEEALAILQQALQSGIDTLDTARVYGNSEEIIGEFIQKKNTQNFKIISKISEEKTEEVENDLNETLKRLNASRIYGYLIHNFEQFQKNPRLWSKLEELKEQGKVQKIGFSLYYPQEMEFLLEKNIVPDIVQIPFSIFDQRFLPFFPLLKKKGIEIHVRSVFLQGLVFKKPEELQNNFIKIKDKIVLLNSLSQYLNIPLSAICLGFAVLNSSIDKVIIGVDSLANLQENIDSLKYQNQIQNINLQLLNLKENDEGIILPFKWENRQTEEKRIEKNHQMKIVAIIQARMGSTRFPGKMMALLDNKPLLQHVFEGVKKAKLVDEVVLATSQDPENQILINEAKKQGVQGFAGDENDVLDRYYQAAKQFQADIIVRITGDCPLIDPRIIDQTISLFQNNKVDYASNVDPSTYPDGLDVEVFSFPALEKAWQEANLKSEREHVTPYITKNKNLFRQADLKNEEDLSHLRLTVDEKEDLLFLNELIRKIRPQEINLKNITDTLQKNPELNRINQRFQRNEGYQKSLMEDRIGTSQKLYLKAKKLIPGGTQLLSKRPELFLPDLWPAYYQKAKGCVVWDLDGNKYVDMCEMGIGANIIGYADKDVNRAVKKAIAQSSMNTLNCPEEVELAELLCELHPWAERVRYARTGGEAMAIAVRIARAKTEKDLILFCGYHGWHDWYLSANLAAEKQLDGHLLPGLKPKGVPRNLTGTVIPFNYNNLSEFLKLVEEYRGKIAAVVMEPLRNQFPDSGFLETIRELTEKEGIVLIFDEVTSGFRLTLGGAHLKFNLNPDIAVFGKGISNGYPMAAIIGKSEVMDAAQETFISSTYWTERIGPTAALVTIKKLAENNVPEYLNKIGQKIQEGWKSLALKNNLTIEISGIYPLSNFSFKHEKPLVIKTLFTQLMLEKGFLASTSFYASYAHKKRDVKKYLQAVDESFNFIAQKIKEGNPEKYLKGPICHSGFKRLN